MKNQSGKGSIGSIILLVVVIVIAIAVGGFIIVNNNTKYSNDKAQSDVNGRYLTIRNNTEQIINKVTVEVGNGTEINNMERTNPDEKSFSIEIPEQYKEYTNFTVILIDRYNMTYKKEVNNVPEKGRTEVVISKDDYEQKKGDFWNKMDKVFNGDNN